MSITVSIQDVTSLRIELNKYNDKKYESLFKRIVYFGSNDLSYNTKDTVNPYFVILKDKNKIIGVAKVGYFELSSVNEQDYSISFFSIDKDYRYKGYCRLMCDELFKYAKEKAYCLSTSKYTVLGKRQLEKLFLEYSQKYNVNFRNSVGIHDSKCAYGEKNGKLYRLDEI